MYRIVLLTLLAGALAEQALPGRCDIAGLKHIPVDDVSPFADKTWYLQATFGSEWIGGACPTAVTHLNNVHPKTIQNRDVLFLMNDKLYNISRPIILYHTDDFRQNFYPYIVEESRRVIFYVLDADINSYALLYACVEDTSYTKIVNAQFLTLTKNWSSEMDAKLVAFSQEYEDLKQSNWTLHDHTNCPF